MSELLTPKEIRRTQELCFSNPAKACALAQVVADTCQLVTCATFARVNGKAPRTVQYQAARLNGVKIAGQKFISINQNDEKF